MKDLNESDPTFDVRLVELGERVAKLEALIEMHEKTFKELREEIRDVERRLESRMDRLEARIDRFFWLWVGTVAAGIILRLLHLV